MLSERNRIGLLGGNGFVGSIINKELNAISPSRKDVDITLKYQVEEWIENLRSDTVVLTAAYTDTKNAYLQEDLARMINVFGVRVVAEAARKFNKHVIFISTGFVFTGEVRNPGPYCEDEDPELGDPAQRGVYAATKLEGEKVLKDVLGEDCYCQD